MPITDYNKKKKLEVSSKNDSGTTQDKAQPVLVKGETTFDISEASLTDSFDFSSEEAGPTGLAFNDTGDKLFIIGSSNDSVFEYSLSTSFDVSTASFVDSFDVSGQDAGPRGLAFSDTGDKMFVSGAANDNVYEYSLSTSFDISTASFTDSFDISGQSGISEGVTFSDTGDKMFVVGSFNDSVFEYSLSTSFDVSTASFVDSFDVSGQDTLPTGVVFGDSGNKMFVIGSIGDKVYEYSIGESESKTGTGDVVIDFTNISGPEDIAVYDENGNLLDYEIESLDTAAETGVIWAYDSWVRDDTVQAQVAYGNNSSNTDRQNVTGTWDNTDQNAVLVQHLQDDPLTATDSTANNNDGTVTGALSTTGQFDGAANFDGSDDKINFGTGVNNLSSSDSFSMLVWHKTSTVNDAVTLMGDADNNQNFQGIRVDESGSEDKDDWTFAIRDSNGNQINTLSTENVRQADNTWRLFVFTYNGSGNSSGMNIFKDDTDTNVVLENTTSLGNDIEPNTPWLLGERSDGRNIQADLDEHRFYNKEVDLEFIQAEYDASPKAGQVYFSQQAAEATVTDQTVSVPETQTTSTNPDPQVNATVDVSIPTTTATTVNAALNVSPGAASLNLTATTASTANPDFTVQPGNTTVQTPVSTATVSNPDPAVNAFNEVTVPETTAATVNPAPTLTVGQTIITPETTVTSSNPDLTVQPGETSLNISTTQVSASNPVIGLNRQIVVGVATNLESENPEPNLQAGAVSVQVPETTTLTENPALQLQPGATSLQTEQPTNLETVNPDFNTVAGAAELQVSETQLTSSIQEPSIGLTLQFVSPTNALITNDERFFDMPDHTFTEADLGDTLQATLKDEVSPDGVDLTGATEIRLVVKDRDGVKVFDKEMSLADSSNGDVEYKWGQGDFIEEPGVYRSKIKVFDSSDEPESFPNDGFRTIEVEEEIG